MKTIYDADADALYVRFADAAVVESEEVADGVVLEHCGEELARASAAIADEDVECVDAPHEFGPRVGLAVARSWPAGRLP